MNSGLPRQPGPPQPGLVPMNPNAPYGQPMYQMPPFPPVAYPPPVFGRGVGPPTAPPVTGFTNVAGTGIFPLNLRPITTPANATPSTSGRGVSVTSTIAGSPTGMKPISLAASPLSIPKPAISSKNDWSVHKSPDGKIYYYNSKTNVSTWEKPYELKTPDELATSCVWKEYTSDSGKKYYYNHETNKSMWEMPDEYKEFLKRQGKLDKFGNEKDDSSKNKAKIETTQIPDPITAKKDFAHLTKPEATQKFKELLRDCGITSEMTWDVTLPKIVHDERYKVLRNLSEKKNEHIPNIKLKNVNKRKKKNVINRSNSEMTLNQCYKNQSN